MVNVVAGAKPLLRGLMKMRGFVPHAVEIDSGTVINIWIPNPNHNKQTLKPVVVLVHGFAGDGITTWLFQVGSLAKKYSVYVPDLLFFGGSVTDKPDRTAAFQAECLAKALRKLGIERCAVVGFSYGGMVAFKMAELHPMLVQALLVSGSVAAMTDSISAATLGRLRYSTWQELLMPKNVKECKALLKIAMQKKLWFPHCLYKHSIQVFFPNTKERLELLEGLVVPTKDTSIPNFSQRIHLLWGEEDQILNQELAHSLKEDLGDKATYQGIKNAGHLVHMERPCVYNRCLKHFLHQATKSTH